MKRPHGNPTFNRKLSLESLFSIFQQRLARRKSKLGGNTLRKNSKITSHSPLHVDSARHM